MNISFIYKRQKNFRYVINVMEQAAYKMIRTGYSTRWSEIAYRIGNKQLHTDKKEFRGAFVLKLKIEFYSD